MEKNLNFIDEVLEAHNKIRKNPQSFIPILEKQLTYFKGSILYRPGTNVGLQTNEGPSAVKECIKFLKGQKKVSELTLNKGLCKAAQDHADDIGPKGVTGHAGSDGSDSSERIERYVNWNISCAENIDFGSTNGEDVIVSLAVDDGVSSRGHRENLFSDSKYIGIGIAEHTVYRTVIVLDYVGDLSGKDEGGDTGLVKSKSKITIPRKVGLSSNVQSKLQSLMENGKDDEKEDDEFTPLDEIKLDDEESEIKEVAIKTSQSVQTKSSKKAKVRTVVNKYILKDGSEYTFTHTETVS